MIWDRLLTTDKLVEDEKDAAAWKKYPINEFEKDYNKIVSSAAFRRLQDKTQVFPLDKSDFVRTRLTHSVEVSTIARQIGMMITVKENPYPEHPPKDDMVEIGAESIPSILVCAGLLHDLGNPPFGHFGEDTIGLWFKENLGKIDYKDAKLKYVLNDRMSSDLEFFDGNAQALRIVAKALHNSEINLSKSVISALVKYPINSVALRTLKKEGDKKHKLGYFFAEEEAFFEISKIVGTINEEGKICRHPLSFVLEAADDIAYATADLEDAFKKEMFSLSDFIDFFEKAVSKTTGDQHKYSQLLIDNLKERRNKETDAKKDSIIFAKWLAYARRWLMYVSAYSFSLNYNDIMSGNFKENLFHGTFHQESIIILKEAMREFAFNSHGILKLELSSQNIFSFLLGNFVRAVRYYENECDNFKPTKADKKYINLLSDNYKQDYKSAKTGNEAWDLYLRLLMVTDYISGMTDTYARTLYRELYGIE